MAINVYCSLSDIKAALPDSALSTVSTYDSPARMLITNASRMIDHFTNRKPGAYYVDTDVTRYFDGPSTGLFSPIYGYKTQRLSGGGYSGAISLRVGEMAAFPTSVSMALTAAIASGNGANAGTYTLVPATDYYAEPQNALDDGIPFNYLILDIIGGTTRLWYPFRRGIMIVGKFGYSTAVPYDIREATILMVVRLLRKAQQNYLNVASINGAGQIMQGDRIDDDIANTIRHYRRLAI